MAVKATELESRIYTRCVRVSLYRDASLNLRTFMVSFIKERGADKRRVSSSRESSYSILYRGEMNKRGQ